jgi:hypothetical protein
MPGAVAEPHPAQRLTHLRTRGPATRETQWQGDVLGGGQRRETVEGLEDEADEIPPQQGQPPLAQPRQLRAAHLDRSGRRPVEAGRALQQRRFARAGRPHDRGVGPGAYREVDAVEGGHVAIGAAYAGKPYGS